MKRVLFTLIILFLLVGCNHQLTRLIDVPNEKLSQSLNDYYNIHSKEYHGEHFESKVEIIKVEAADTIYYRYLVVIAPVYDESIDIKYIDFDFETGACESYFKQNDYYYGINEFDMFCNQKSKLDWPEYHKIEDLKAMIFASTISNNGNMNFDNSNVQITEFEKVLSNFTITIGYNNKEDKIHISDVKIFDYDENLMASREDLKELSNDKGTGSVLTTYLSEDYINQFVSYEK